jgi:hypothetical protein
MGETSQIGKIESLANVLCDPCSKCNYTGLYFDGLLDECNCNCHEDPYMPSGIACCQEQHAISESLLVLANDEAILDTILSSLRLHRISYQVNADAESLIMFACRKHCPGPWYYGAGVTLLDAVIDGVENYIGTEVST